MTTITLTYNDDEVEKFKRVLLVDEIWDTLHEVNDVVSRQVKTGPPSEDLLALNTVKDILDDILWRCK